MYSDQGDKCNLPEHNKRRLNKIMRILRNNAAIMKQCVLFYLISDVDNRLKKFRIIQQSFVSVIVSETEHPFLKE